MFSITKDGKELSKELYTRDEETKTLSTKENGLVLDFSNYNGVTFKTGFDCAFKTGSYCTFDTSSYCTFNTSSYCTFKTGFDCAFKTGFDCTFNTSSYCTFDTSSGCTFKTGAYCVVVRRDIHEVMELKEGEKIKLNGYGKKGYTIVRDTYTIILDGKEINISEESFEEFKKQFIK